MVPVFCSAVPKFYPLTPTLSPNGERGAKVAKRSFA
jgi:hypothetical protein